MAGLGSEESKKVPKSWNIYKGWGVNAWDKWTKKANKRRELGQPPIPKASTLDVVSEQELDQYLKDFFTNMTRSDGTAFKKASALNICRGLAAHLVINLKCPHLNFMACHDNYFPEFQKTAYRTSKVSRKGKQIENSFDQTNPENRLWDKHFDDLDSPVGLLHAVYAFNTFVFGVESVDSHCSLVPNQYLLSSDKDGDFIKFYGNIKETKSSEDKTPIFSVEERKLYDTGESDSVYNIFKKYLKGIPTHGKFYLLPCTSIQKQAGKEKYVKGSPSSPLNLSQIQDLHEHLVSSRSYKKLHILEDFDVEKRRINLINPLFFPQQTNTTAMCATETKEISKTLDKMIMPLRMENSAEGLLQEENDDDNFHTSSSVTQKATNTSQSPVSDQIQDMQEDEEPKTMEPSLPVTTPNVVSYTPNVMSHTQGSPNMMTATPNMMTHTPNMMTRTPRMMTDIIRRGTSNCHFNPVMKPLNIQTSTETEFTIRNPFDDQTLLLRTNVDKAKDPSFRHMENFLQHGVDPLSHHFQQLSYYHQSRYPVYVGQHVSPWDYLYTNTIASRYMDPNHMRPPAQHGHLSGKDTRGIVSDPGQAVSEVPRMVPPIAQHLTSQGYKHPSFEMDKTSGTYQNYQPHMNARDNSYTPQEIFNPLHRINPGLKGQLPYMGRTLSRAQTMNHCASLNKETMSVSQDEYSPLSGMTPSEFHNKKFTSVSHEEQSTLSGATPNEFHDLRQKCKGRGQKLSPSLASLLQQAETSDRDRMNDQMEHLQGLRQAHIVNCEQNSSVNQTIERNIRKRHASKCDSETPNKFRRINQGRSEDMMGKLDVTDNNCKDQENSPQTKSAQHSETPVLKTETKNKDQKNYQQPKSSPQSVAPLLKIIQIIEDIVSSQFPRKTNPNESSVDSGTTDPADTSYSEQTTQNQESLLQEDVINNSKANDYVDTTSCELTSQNLESLQEDAPNNSKPEDFVDIPDQQQNTTESENPDQDIKLLLDFDPSLRESFHKKCEDWWMKHKSQFEMNNLLTVKSNSQSSVSKDSNNDEMSENALDENQQEQLEEDQSTDNATPTKSGYTNMSEMDGNLASDHSMCDIPACSNLDPRHSIIVRAPDLPNQNTAENTKPRDYVDNCCEADDVKCMSALYVDW